MNHNDEAVTTEEQDQNGGLVCCWDSICSEHTKALLVECVASHLKQGKLRKHSVHGRLKSSSDRIRERLVSAIAHELQVPLLKLDDLDYDGEDDDSDKEEDDSDDAYESQAKADPKVCKLKKGDKVKYVGKAIPIEEANNRKLLSVYGMFMQISLRLLS